MDADAVVVVEADVLTITLCLFLHLRQAYVTHGRAVFDFQISGRLHIRQGFVPIHDARRS